MSLLQYAFAVWDEKLQKNVEFKDLITNPKTKATWTTSYANELGRLAQGIRDIKGSNCIYFIPHTKVPRNKQVTYARMVVDYRPTKSDPNRTRVTVGGNLLSYEGELYTETTDLITIKLLLNSVLSTPNAKFMSLDIKNFYLGTPMKEYEYMKIKYDTIPTEIIQKYNLQTLQHNGHIYIEIRKGMYGLKQAGVLANLHLEKLLAEDGYIKTEHTPGLWKHTTKPILFVLCVDDFGIKYINKEDAHHLIKTLKKHYEALSIDWEGTKFCGINFDWD